MALPPKASVWADSMDPSDLVEYRADFAGGPKPLLEPNEKIASYTATLHESAVQHGVFISEADGFEPKRVNDDTAVELAFEVDVEERENPAFAAGGVQVGVVFTVITTDGRRRQRTWVWTIEQL